MTEIQKQRENITIQNRIEALRVKCRANGVDAYLVTTEDYHNSEYVGDYFKVREYLSGFTGSAGRLVVTAEETCLWTDGRYFLQAEEELKGTGIRLMKMGEKDVLTIPDYLKEHLSDGAVVGMDGRCVSQGFLETLEHALSEKGITFQTEWDLGGEVWEELGTSGENERPAIRTNPLWLLPEQLSGTTRTERIRMVRDRMKEKKAQVLFTSSLDEIAWLFLIRGGDIAFNPVVLSYAVITERQAYLYVREQVFSKDTLTRKDLLPQGATFGTEAKRKLEAEGIVLRPYASVYEDLEGIVANHAVMADPEKCNCRLYGLLKSASGICEDNTIEQLKAIKTVEEQENERKAHIKDGVAVIKLLAWLDNDRQRDAIAKGELTELQVAEQLLTYRKAQEFFLDQSFAPIVATGPHGAIIHYEPTEESNGTIMQNSFLLMDTGAQYLQGTTDITRTVVTGTVSEVQKRHYTAVLKGNLRLGAAVFKEGFTGANLDILAREPLFRMGLNYNHGTGHGVGFLLNVHEGPQSIRPKGYDGKMGPSLQPGMITSNEPGLYLPGEYGIRLENMILCVEKQKTEYGNFYGFETLTLVPFDRRGILPKDLTEEERMLLNSYHKRVWEVMHPYLEEEERDWLRQMTEAI